MARRQFGLSASITAGVSLDDLRTAQSIATEADTEVIAIPDATRMYPVQGVTVNKNARVRERTDEVRGVRGYPPPQSFRQAPAATVRDRIYMPMLKDLIQLYASTTPTTSGGTGSAITSVTGATAGNLFTKVAHGLTNGKLVMLSALSGGSGLSTLIPYYVISAAADTFQLARRIGGPAVSLGTTVSGVTVTNISAKTTAWTPFGYGTSALYAAHATIVRDDIQEKIASCALTSLGLTFSNEGDSTLEAQLAGTFMQPVTDTVPTADYSDPGYDLALLLRDAKLYLNGSGSAVDGLSGYTINLDNALVDPYDNNAAGFPAGKNRWRHAPASGKPEAIVQYPRPRKPSSAQTITGTLNFSDVQAAQEAKKDLQETEQLVFEVEGQYLGTSTASRQMLRITTYASVLTDGGFSDLARDGDITSEYQWVAALDPSNQDLKIEVVDAT